MIRHAEGSRHDTGRSAGAPTDFPFCSSGLLSSINSFIPSTCVFTPRRQLLVFYPPPTISRKVFNNKDLLSKYSKIRT